MANNQVSVEITLEEKAALKALTQLTQSVQKTEGAFTKMGNEGDKSMGIVGQATSGVSTGFKSLVGGVTVANLASSAIIGTANAVKDFVVGSVNAAIEQENAINRLNQALRVSGDFSQRASQDFINFSGELQKVSIFGDEVVIGQIAVAKSFGATNAQAKQLVEAAANLSATFGGSLESNVEKLGKTFSGSAGRLAQYIPALKELTEEQLKSGQAFEIVNSKFAGAAANELNTYGGKVTAAQNAFSDLQEEMGRFVIENGYVSSALDIAKTSFNGLIGAQRALNHIFGLSNGALSAQREQMQELGAEYNAAVTSLNSLNGMRDAAVKFGVDDEANQRRILDLTKAIEEVEKRKIEIMKERQKLRTANVADQKAAEEADQATNVKGGISEADQKLVDSRNAAYAALIQSQVEYAAYQAEQSVLSTEINAANYQGELDQLIGIEQAKIDAKFAAEEQKVNLISDAASRSLGLQKISADKELAMAKATNDSKKKIDDLRLKQEQDLNRDRINNQGDTFATISTLAQSNNNSLAAIGKAAGITQIAIDTPVAISKALAAFPPPFNFVAAGLVGTAMAAQASRIAGIKFEHGGIVKGNSMTGDGIQARVNSGEMILNRQQQTELFNVANGSGGNGDLVDEIRALRRDLASQPINLSVDGRALATVIRGEVRAGFKLS